MPAASPRPTKTDPKVQRAYAHPLRVKAMELLEARVTSPNEIATALGEPVGVIAYHVRALRDAGLVTLVERRRRRGAIEHFYTAPAGPTVSDWEWRRLPLLKRRSIMAGGLQRFGRELGDATARGGLERDGAHVARVRARLDDRGWRAAARELGTALDRVEGLTADAKLRLTSVGPGRTQYGIAMLMLFKEPRPPPGHGRPGAADSAIDLADPRILAADAHPLRAEIFRVLCEREGSPSDVARELGAPISNASYHIRQLVGLGLLRLTERRESRGALEHYYRASVRPTILGDAWLDSIADSGCARLAGAILGAARDGGFDHDDIHFTRTPFPVDRQAWADISDGLAVARRRVEQLAGERSGPAEAEPAPGDEVSVVTMLFGWTPAALAEPRASSVAAPS